MALWTTAWELQRKEIRLKDRQEHQQQQQPRSQQQQEGKTAEGRAWLHYCAHAHSLLCMLYVGLMWAAEKVWQWGLGKNAQKSTDGPGDLLARSQRVGRGGCFRSSLSCSQVKQSACEAV
jgi:hypothetical protein